MKIHFEDLPLCFLDTIALCTGYKIKPKYGTTNWSKVTCKNCLKYKNK